MTMTAGTQPQPPSPAPSFADIFFAIARAVGTAIHGKDDVIRASLTCLLAEGHLLIEDVPGVGKTSLAKALAALGRLLVRPRPVHPRPPAVGRRRRRRCGTRDDEQRSTSSPARSSPTSSSADEINRASPKTQSALLEAMAERQVTVDGATHPLPQPFMVIATQNPIEHEGTYPAAREPARPLPDAAVGGLPRLEPRAVVAHRGRPRPLARPGSAHLGPPPGRGDGAGRLRGPRRRRGRGLRGGSGGAEPIAPGHPPGHLAPGQPRPAAGRSRCGRRPRAATTSPPTT